MSSWTEPRKLWSRLAALLSDATRRARWLAVAGTLLLGVVVCLLTGLSPGLPFVLALLAVSAVRPMVGLVYVMVVLVAPLGLWLLGVEALVGWAFGGRDYALSLSAAVVLFVLLPVTAVRQRVPRRQFVTAGLVGLVLAVWTLVGFAHHGVAQTLVGLRLVVTPLVMLSVMAALNVRNVRRLMTVMSWLLLLQGVAAISEVIIGPARLQSWGFEADRAIRYMDGTFRAPGLTEFNAELGMLAGAYLLGYVALWLTRSARPTRWSWHAAAIASVICLALSTSRSGALMLAGGVTAAALLNRSGSAAAQRRARLLAGSVIACVVVGFVAVGATASRSLFQRFEVWSSLLSSDVPLYGFGIGGVGAATTSRIAGGPQIFVDNYFVSLALQFGLLVLGALVALLGYALLRLWRRSADHPLNVLYIAVLAGLACSCLVIEAWEYAAAMMCLALFVAYGRRLDSTGSPVRTREAQVPQHSTPSPLAPRFQPGSTHWPG